jgi:AcrR family transcriptional regulator
MHGEGGDDVAALGLRERKRRETRRRIQLSVLRLTAANGLDQVTTDDISRDAGVSPRTFFNYFPTKEASLAGDVPFSLSDEAAAGYVDAGPLGEPLGQLLELITEQAGDAGAVDSELHALRRSVMRDYPQIFALRIDKMREFEAAVTEVVARRLARDGEKRGEATNAQADAERARVVALVAMALGKAAWATWLEHPGDASLPEVLERSYRRLQETMPLAAPAR